MLRSLLTCLILVAVLSSACRKDFEYGASNGNLRFSKDTVFLNTIFSDISSSTYLLKVYNTTRDDIEIPSVSLGKGENSNYRLNVDGVAGKTFKNIPLYAKDSLFIFIETTINTSNDSEKSFLDIEILNFDSGDHQQQIPLVTLVKNATFLYPNQEVLPVSLQLNPEEEKITSEGFILQDNQLLFTNEKAYVIYGYAIVPENKELIIDSGARVHFHRNSGILMRKNAAIKINGELSEDMDNLENQIIFEGDRLEPVFSDIPAQWNGIYFEKGSSNNIINYLTLKNAVTGIKIEGEDTLSEKTLIIKNSQIYNNSVHNLWAKTASINAENTVLGSSGSSSLYCNLGGDYSFTHCTIANYWNKGFRLNEALKIDNFNEEEQANLKNATFMNSIIDGNSTNELLLESNQTNTFNFSFSHCLIKQNSGSENPLYNFENQAFYTNIIFNENAGYTNAPENNFSLQNASILNAKADVSAANLIPLDIQGKARITSPEIGAYEIIEEE